MYLMYLSSSEIRQEVNSLTKEDIIRLKVILIRYSQVSYLSNFDADDLIAEIITRVLSGTWTKLRAGKNIVDNLAWVGKSIASSYYKQESRDKDIYSSVDQESLENIAESHSHNNNETEVSIQKQMNKFRIQLSDDPQCLTLLEHLIVGTPKQKNMAALNIDEKQYSTIRRRMIRRLQNTEQVSEVLT